MSWDADGEGSLSPAEIIKAFVSIGLSQDHHFARKIMHSIRPHKADHEDNEEDADIELKDFITIFRNDEVSDNVIKMINEEVNYRKKVKHLRMMKNKHEYETDCSECNPVEGNLSISMRSEFNDLIGDSSQEGEVTVEIPLDKKRINQIKINIKTKDEPMRSKTYNINNN